MLDFDKSLKEDAKQKLKLLNNMLEVIKDNELDTYNQVMGVIHSFKDTISIQAGDHE